MVEEAQRGERCIPGAVRHTKATAMIVIMDDCQSMCALRTVGATVDGSGGMVGSESRIGANGSLRQAPHVCSEKPIPGSNK